MLMPTIGLSYYWQWFWFHSVKKILILCWPTLTVTIKVEIACAFVFLQLSVNQPAHSGLTLCHSRSHYFSSERRPSPRWAVHNQKNTAFGTRTDEKTNTSVTEIAGGTGVGDVMRCL